MRHVTWTVLTGFVIGFPVGLYTVGHWLGELTKHPPVVVTAAASPAPPVPADPAAWQDLVRGDTRFRMGEVVTTLGGAAEPGYRVVWDDGDTVVVTDVRPPHTYRTFPGTLLVPKTPAPGVLPPGR